MKRNSNSKKTSKPSNRVRIRSIYNQAVSVNPVSTATNIGEITTSNTGIWSLNNQISSLSDMFRLFKVNGLKFEFLPATTLAGGGLNVPSGILMISLNGQTNPTVISDAETPLQSNLTTPWGASSTGQPEALVKETVARLSVRNADLPISQGPSSPGDAGYLVTQDDGTQTSYGRLFWLLVSAAASTTLNYVLRTYFDLDFKDILDPSTISSIQAQKAADAVSYHCSLQAGGAGAHIEFSPGLLEKAIQLHLKVNRGVQFKLPSQQRLTSCATDPDRDQLIQQLQEQLDSLKG